MAVGPIINEPGQRETLTSGREQDLVTPILQAVALCVASIWTLAWLFAMTVATGPLVFYVLVVGSVGAQVLIELRKRQSLPDWRWIVVSIVWRMLVAFVGDLIWMDYRLGWPLWSVLYFDAACLLLMSPGVLVISVLFLRLIDPTYPNPRKAIERYGPQLFWQRDPAMMAYDAVRETVPVRLDLADGHGNHKMLDVDVTSTLQQFAAAVIADQEQFSERGAMELGSRKAERKQEFIALRDEMIDRALIGWKNADNHQSGYWWTAAAIRALEEIRDYPLSVVH